LNGKPLDAQEHHKTAATERANAKTCQRVIHDDTLAAILSTATPLNKRRIKRSASTGAWLTTLPNLINGSDLSADEFCDRVRLRLGLKPTSLPPRCDGCGEHFTIEHAMSCRKGGLILHRHNDLVTTWGQLCGQAHTPSTVSNEPLIQPSRDMLVAATTCTVPSPELRGDLAVHGFWTQGQTAIFDVCITDSDLLIGTQTHPKSSFATKRRKKPNMETFALPEDALSPHLSSLLMVSLVKKQLQHQNYWLPA
jgi:hypothetical protein